MKRITARDVVNIALVLSFLMVSLRMANAIEAIAEVMR